MGRRRDVSATAGNRANRRVKRRNFRETISTFHPSSCVFNSVGLAFCWKTSLVKSPRVTCQLCGPKTPAHVRMWRYDAPHRRQPCNHQSNHSRSLSGAKSSALYLIIWSSPSWRTHSGLSFARYLHFPYSNKGSPQPQIPQDVLPSTLGFPDYLCTKRQTWSKMRVTRDFFDYAINDSVHFSGRWE